MTFLSHLQVGVTGGGLMSFQKALGKISYRQELMVLYSIAVSFVHAPLFQIFDSLGQFSDLNCLQQSLHIASV